MALIKSFRDLNVYAAAREQARQIFEVTKRFPRECQYLNPALFRELDAAWQTIGGMLNRMIERADDFCRTSGSK